MKAIMYDKDGTLMRFDAFWIPVTKAAIRSIIKTIAPENFKFADQTANEIEKKIGITGQTADPAGILCGGTYSQFADAANEVFAKFGINEKIDGGTIERATADSVNEGEGSARLRRFARKTRKGAPKSKAFRRYYRQQASYRVLS